MKNSKITCQRNQFTVPFMGKFQIEAAAASLIKTTSHTVLFIIISQGIRIKREEKKRASNNVRSIASISVTSRLYALCFIDIFCAWKFMLNKNNHNEILQ